jgi:hypothetical protein
MSPARGYNPPDSTLADLKHLHATLGIDRVVFTQPSTYGTDNSAMLAAMRRLHWMQIEHLEQPGQEFISIRPTFGEALEHILPVNERRPDPDYEDFRLRFFFHVFHPTPVEKTEWLDEIVNHRWYLKLQRRRFGHPDSAAEREADVARGGALRSVTIRPGETWSFNATIGSPANVEVRTIGGVPGGGWCDLASRYVQAVRPLLPREAVQFVNHVTTSGIRIADVADDDAVSIWNIDGQAGSAGQSQDLQITNTLDTPLRLLVVEQPDQQIVVRAALGESEL